MNEYKPATGSVQQKDGKWHACINYTDISTGKRKIRWKMLGKIDPRGRNGISKSKANQLLKDLIAEQDAETEKALKDLKRFEGLSSTEVKKVKLAEKDFYQAVVDCLMSDTSSLKAKTLQGYLTLTNCHLKEYFHGKYRLMDVDVKAVNGFYEYLYGLGLKTTTILRYKALLQRTLKRAVSEEVIDKDPMPFTKKLHKGEFEIKPFSLEESEQLLHKMSESYDECNIIVQLALYYGIRRSEILGLRYSSIDFESKTIRFDQNVVELKPGEKFDIKRCKNAASVYAMENGHKLVIQDLPKTKSSKRTLPLFDFVADLLREQQKLAKANRAIFGRQYDKRFSDYVCVRSDGQLIMPNFVTTHYGRMLQKFGMRKVRFHDLRHTTATLLLTKAHVPLQFIQQWLGHSDINTTISFYSHLDIENAKSTGREIEGFGWFNEHSNPKITEEIEKRERIVEKLSQ